MSLFLQELFHSPLLARSLAAMVLAAVACGIVGCYVVLKRDSYAVGAVSHSLLGGVGAVLFLSAKYSLAWLTPWLGGLAAAILVAVFITLGTARWRFRTDTVLSAVWALGMAIGISFVTAMPGYPPDLNSYLFGSILIVSPQDLWMTALLDAFVLLLAILWHQRFVALAFHSEILTLRGISTTRVQLALQLMIAVTVVILSQLVGIILCMALLILPVAAAATLSRRIPVIMALAGAFCFGCCFLGVGLSYDTLPGNILLSPGATIVELAGMLYLGTGGGRMLANKLRRTRNS